MSEKILIADDDEDIRRFIEVNLLPEGFETISAADGLEALSIASEEQPDLVLLDVMMPKLDGFEVCRMLRSDPRTSHICVILLTAKSLSTDKLVGLSAGADDYIIKPFDPLELIARVKTTLRRAEDMRALSPLTGLPGNTRILEEIRRRAAAGESFAVCYADLDYFKAYNDHYGFLRGDGAIMALAGVLHRAVDAAAPGAFIGHIGGDDFIVLVGFDEAERFSKAAIDLFDRESPALHDRADVERGTIEVVNRQGNIVRHPLMALSIGIALAAPGSVADHRQLVAAATEMKKYAKEQAGSSYAVDRRGQANS